jgi:hypothetical protein
MLIPIAAGMAMWDSNCLGDEKLVTVYASNTSVVAHSQSSLPTTQANHIMLKNNMLNMLCRNIANM